MRFEETQVGMVCKACFNSSKRKMLEHGETYLRAGHTAVPDLGAGFRSIVKHQNRQQWWQRAVRALKRELGASIRSIPEDSADIDGLEALLTAVNEAHEGGRVVICRNRRPVAAIISIADLKALERRA